MNPLLIITCLVIAITIHEFAHAKMADALGDPTPGMMGRLTLNPVRHFDPFGFMMIVITSTTGYGIGWGKPVLTNPSNFDNERWGSFWVAIAGPLSNFLQAAVACVIFRVLVPSAHPNDLLFLVIFAYINILLMCFNLIPFGPLDGHWVLGAFLPEPHRTRWHQFSRTTGTLVLLGVIIFSQAGNFDIISKLIDGPVETIMRFLLGK